MNEFLGSHTLDIAESIICLVALASIILRKQWSDYKYLGLLLSSHTLFGAILMPMILLGGRGIERHLAYHIYFYAYWSSFAIESVLSLLLIYSIFSMAMAPLHGIRRLGTLVFRWAASISLAVALGSVLIPNINEFSFVTNFISELQRTQSILTLCLLLFVCFAIRPLGLSYSSRLFGVCLGLGILASTNLVVSACMAHFKELYSLVNTGGSIATCSTFLLWTAYFALPEPKRRIIVLPTTSPFLRWNQISEVLGDAPGFVAIAGIPPELFAPAELEIMRRASIKISQQPVTDLHHPQTA